MNSEVYHEKVKCVALDSVINLKGKLTSLGSIVFTQKQLINSSEKPSCRLLGTAIGTKEDIRLEKSSHSNTHLSCQIFLEAKPGCPPLVGEIQLLSPNGKHFPVPRKGIYKNETVKTDPPSFQPYHFHSCHKK